MATSAPSPQHHVVALRHRRSARSLTVAQAADLRRAFGAGQAIGDDRGYQHYAGIHGLPLPMYCTHNSPLFLAWHRAYLYFFERALQDHVPGVTLPWWDWTAAHAEGVPLLYSHELTPAREPNSLFSSSIQPGGRKPGGPDHTVRAPGAPNTPPLPTAQQVASLLALSDFLDFQSQLEDLHNGVHAWVGGTMGDISTAAYDPLFWAHHTMIDRLWRLWELRHAHAGFPRTLLRRALAPFNMTVAQTLDSSALGYDYAISTAAAAGPAR